MELSYKTNKIRFISGEENEFSYTCAYWRTRFVCDV